MYIKIINPATDGKQAYTNRGSARQATNYLEGEAKKQGDTAVFFNAEKDQLSGDEAVQLIDSNRKGLRRDDAKFFSLVVSPSAEELAHIRNDPERLKAFTTRVMQEYAGNFTLKSGKSLDEKDLVWVATKHEERKHRGHDGAPSGQKKEGPQTHIHLMVSARDKEQKITLNPLGNKDRFNRVTFYSKSNVTFEQEFGYVKQAARQSKTREAAAGKGQSTDSKRPRTAEEIAESIRRRAAAKAASEGRRKSSYVNWRFYEPADEKRDKQLFNQIDKLNRKLPPDRQLEHNKVQETARSLDYSKEFYGRLGQLGRDADKQKYHELPYQFLRTGKDAKTITSTFDEERKRDKRLFDQVDRLSKKLPDDRQLVHTIVLQIAREQEYSKAFYGRLGRIGREAQGPKEITEPYRFLSTGRVHRAEQTLPGAMPPRAKTYEPRVPQTASYPQSKNRTARMQPLSPARSVAGLGRDIGRALETEGYTQDIRGDEERE